MSMPQLAITHDFFRCAAVGLPSVASNARWLFSLLRPLCSQLFTTTSVVAALEDGGKVDVSAALRALELSAEPSSWARLTSDREFDEAIYSFLEPHFEGVTHVVGFGMTPTMMRFLDRIGVKFIDFECAQIRFVQKINFRVRSNCPDFSKIIENLIYPDSLHLAEILPSISARSYGTKFELARRGVFLGQSHIDLALVERGRLRRPYDDDLLETLRVVAENLDDIQILPHPAAQTRLGNLLPLAKNLPTCHFSNRNTYAALADPETVCAVSLSSGALREATLFGVDSSIALIAPDRDNRDCLPETLSDWVEVYDTILSVEAMAAFSGKKSVSMPPLKSHGIVEAALGKNSNSFITAPACEAIPMLTPAEVYDTAVGSHGSSILQFGWSTSEDWGTWSVANAASLAFKPSVDEQCKIRLKGRRYVHNYDKFTVMADATAVLTVGNKRIKLEMESEGEAWFAETGILTLDHRTPVFIQFFISGACSPRLLGVSEDSRNCAIGLESITLHPCSGVASKRTTNEKFYERAHTEVEGYLENNWLMPFYRPLRSFGFHTVIECASGNGAFAEVLAPSVQEYWGLDWAASPKAPYSAPNFRQIRWNAYEDELPQGDLVCSADFLEHICQSGLDALLRKILLAGPFHFHVIACFDDNYSHLTIETPEWWMAKFLETCRVVGLDTKEWKLLDLYNRNTDKPVAVLSNLPI